MTREELDTLLDEIHDNVKRFPDLDEAMNIVKANQKKLDKIQVLIDINNASRFKNNTIHITELAELLDM